MDGINDPVRWRIVRKGRGSRPWRVESYWTGPDYFGWHALLTGYPSAEEIRTAFAATWRAAGITYETPDSGTFAGFES